MKLDKRVSKEKSMDQYVLYVPQAEADAAFELMTPFERGMIADLQTSDRISIILKVLSLWAERIEEATGALGKSHHQKGRIKHEG